MGHQTFRTAVHGGYNAASWMTPTATSRNATRRFGQRQDGDARCHPSALSIRQPHRGTAAEVTLTIVEFHRQCQNQLHISWPRVADHFRAVEGNRTTELTSTTPRRQADGQGMVVRFEQFRAVVATECQTRRGSGAGTFRVNDPATMSDRSSGPITTGTS